MDTCDHINEEPLLIFYATLHYRKILELPKVDQKKELRYKLSSIEFLLE